MSKLSHALAALVRRLGIQQPLRARTVRRMKARHADQEKYERQRQKAEDQAERLRNEAHHFNTFGPEEDQAKAQRLLARAGRKEDKAQKLGAKADAQKSKSIVWRGRSRRKTQLIHGIVVDKAKVEKEIAALGPEVDLATSKVTGGTFEERWQKACLTAVECCSNGRRRNAYNEWRPADLHHPFGPGPIPSTGDDCSSFMESICLATDADDPSGLNFQAAGATSTMIAADGRWKEVSLAELHKAGAGFIIYGSGGGRHTEGYCPSPTDIERTVGHGTAAVDFGTVHIFGPGEVERYYIFVE